MVNASPPPATVTDLEATGFALSSLSLSWTAVGADGSSGTAYLYDIRYSEAPITEANFSRAIQAAGEPAPQAAGSTEAFAITSLDNSSTYYFALKVMDADGNLSTLSNVASGSTQAPRTILFSDDVESGAGGWTVAGSDPILWHRATHRSNSPTTAWYYGIDGTRNYETGAINWGTLTSPAFSLSGKTGATLEFNEWSQVQDVTIRDRTRVQLSADGINWSNAFESHGTSGLWAKRVVDLTPYTGGNVYVRFFFDTVSRFSNQYEGWYVDDIRVLATSPNQAPLAGSQTVSTDEDTDLAITLSGSDVDGDVSSFDVESGPANGVLSGDAPNLTYTPNANFNGSDSFTFTVTDDEGGTSEEAMVTITVHPANVSAVVDIRPKSINLNSGGVTPVALLANEHFDAYDVDIGTLRFGVNGTEAATAHGGHIDDLNGDGRDDLMLHFRTKDLGIPLDTIDGTNLYLNLIGLLSNGTGLSGEAMVVIKVKRLARPATLPQTAGSIDGGITSPSDADGGKEPGPQDTGAEDNSGDDGGEPDAGPGQDRGKRKAGNSGKDKDNSDRGKRGDDGSQPGGGDAGAQDGQGDAGDGGATGSNGSSQGKGQESNNGNGNGNSDSGGSDHGQGEVHGGGDESTGGGSPAENPSGSDSADQGNASSGDGDDGSHGNAGNDNAGNDNAGNEDPGEGGNGNGGGGSSGGNGNDNSGEGVNGEGEAEGSQDGPDGGSNTGGGSSASDGPGQDEGQPDDGDGGSHDASNDNAGSSNGGGNGNGGASQGSQDGSGGGNNSGGGSSASDGPGQGEGQPDDGDGGDSETGSDSSGGNGGGNDNSGGNGNGNGGGNSGGGGNNGNGNGKNK